MNRIDRLLAAFLWLLGVLAVAGITHIVAIFALPDVAAKDTACADFGSWQNQGK